MFWLKINRRHLNFSEVKLNISAQNCIFSGRYRKASARRNDRFWLKVFTNITQLFGATDQNINK